MMGALNVKPCVASEQPAARNSVNPAIDILSHESGMKIRPINLLNLPTNKLFHSCCYVPSSSE